LKSQRTQCRNRQFFELDRLFASERSSILLEIERGGIDRQALQQ
jgi:hypothetical protein